MLPTHQVIIVSIQYVDNENVVSLASELYSIHMIWTCHVSCKMYLMSIFDTLSPAHLYQMLLDFTAVSRSLSMACGLCTQSQRCGRADCCVQCPQTTVGRNNGLAQAIVQTCADPAVQEAGKERAGLARDPKFQTHMQFGVACGDKDLDHEPP